MTDPINLAALHSRLAIDCQWAPAPDQNIAAPNVHWQHRAAPNRSAMHTGWELSRFD